MRVDVSPRGVFVSGDAESPAAGARNANRCMQLQEHIHSNHWGGGWGRVALSRPGKSPSPPPPPTLPPPPSQAACLLVIARGIGSPLKRLKACVHVFKRQCYVSVCHLGASALLFSPTLAPFLSFTLYNSGLSAQPVRALACAFVSPWESGLSGKKKKKLRLIIDISLTYNTQQAIEEPAGQGSCHSGAMSDGGPGSGSPSL